MILIISIEEKSHKVGEEHKQNISFLAILW